MKRRREIASINAKLRFTPEQREFLQRRTAPFLDNFGMDRPLSHLMQEAYLQGLRDAAQTLLEPSAPTDALASDITSEVSAANEAPAHPHTPPRQHK